jgi:hypothetical protein
VPFVPHRKRLSWKEKWADARDASLLELLLAHVLESKVKQSADLFLNFAGNAYPAGLSCVTNASSEHH